MRSALLLCSLFAAASAAALSGSSDENKEFIKRQREVLILFTKIQQPILNPEQEEMFDWKTIKDKFKDPTLLERFMYWYDNHVFLERRGDFRLTSMPHFWQLKQLYSVLHSAADFDTFFKIAVWMRHNLNERMFAYALYTVLKHRDDTQHIVLPPPYEVFPEYYVTSDVMQSAYDAYLRGEATKEDNPVVIPANYTGWKEARDEEAAVSYFREDVGLASYWAFFNYKYPSWVNSTDSPSQMAKFRGRLFYVFIRNLLARYDMERYSKGLPPVWQAELWVPVEGYDPQIRHRSGNPFPARPEGLLTSSTDTLTMEDLMDWERRARDGIAMSIYLDDKVQIKQLNEDNAMNMIGNILAGGTDSPNTKYYGSIYNGLFTILGHMMDPYHKYGMAPSTLEIPETMTRDPLFYRILKRMWRVMDGYKNTLPPYHKKDMTVPGLKIESMKVDMLMTFFDDFNFRIDNAIDVQNIEDFRKANVMVRQHRLNHKPFSYSLTVTSDKDKTAVVRLFLGPGDESNKLWSGDDARHHFYLLDAFHTQLKSGENTVVRNSREMFTVGEDPLSLRQLVEKVEAAYKSEQPMEDLYKQRYDGFPHRLLLPKGRRQGLPVTLVAMVTDSKAEMWEGQSMSDGRDPFFPMDRRLFLWELKDVPNAHVEHMKILHRNQEELNVSRQ